MCQIVRFIFMGLSLPRSPGVDATYFLFPLSAVLCKLSGGIYWNCVHGKLPRSPNGGHTGCTIAGGPATDPASEGCVFLVLKAGIQCLSVGMLAWLMSMGASTALAQERFVDPYAAPLQGVQSRDGSSASPSQRMPRIVQDLTRGVRNDGPHVSIAQSPSNTDVMYLGTL